MIYDCFCFFNEFELLELRLHLLAPVVDRFVLVEADRDFMNRPKPLHFAENKEKFSEFLDRIIYVPVRDMPADPDPWSREKHQRLCIARGLRDAGPEDTVLVSDLDEMPRPEAVTDFLGMPGITYFHQDVHYYFLNLRAAEYEWLGTAMCRVKDMPDPQYLRDRREAMRPGICRVRGGGWHFSYMGGVERIIHKIESFAHNEFNLPEYKDPAAIRARIESGRDLFDRSLRFEIAELDETYPEYLLENRNRFEHLIYTPG